MVTFTRYGGSAIFLDGPVKHARCGLVAPGFAGSAIQLGPEILQSCSFAFWDSLASATPAQIDTLFARLETHNQSAPGTGSVLFMALGKNAPASIQRFSRSAPHRLAQSSTAIAFTGKKPAVAPYRLNLNLAGAPVELRIDGDALLFVQPRGQISLAKGTNPLPSPLRGDLAIALTGPGAGQLRFLIDVTREDNLATMSARLRADFTRDTGPMARKSGNAPEHMPRFFPTFRPHRPASGGVHTISLAGEVDPFDLARDRSSFALKAVAPDGSAGLFETHFLTTYGHPVLLREPSANAVRTGTARAPRFLFADQGGADDIDPDISLLPDGDFDLVLPHAARGGVRESFGIMCGLSEREYLLVTDGQRLAFRPGFPAYGGEFPSDDAEVDKQFRATTTSSWVAILDADGTPSTTVIAEDRDYSLFIPAAVAAPAEGGGIELRHRPVPLKPHKLRLLEAAGKGLTSADVEAACLPILPWKGVNVASPLQSASARAERFAGKDWRPIEQRIFSPIRRSYLEPDTKPAIAAGSGIETRHTPMGLEMLVDAGERMQTLRLARTPAKTPGGLALSLELAAIDPKLADALLRSDLFLVADQFSSLATLEPSLSIAGWSFDVDITGKTKARRTSPADGPILIIKGRKGPLRDLLKLPECWALPADLCSTSVADMAGRIEAKHLNRPTPPTDPAEAAVQKAAFERIDKIFKDPDWTGILIYDVKLDPSALPDQITGLLGGVKGAMRAHHIGIDVKRVEPDATDSTTPMFGTLAYVHPDENKPLTVDPPEIYAFRLGRLLVSFNNGLITNFLARGQLATARLFDGEASDTTAVSRRAVAAPVLDIVGRYERRVEHGDVIEVYTFETKFQGQGRIIRLPAGGLIKQLSLRKLSFITLRVDRASGRPVATTRFLLDGDVVFNAWPSASFTLFPQDSSFSFLGLGIDFDFAIKPDFSISISKFAFNPGGLSVDFGKLPNMSGILGKLPFRFRTFEIWPDGIDLDKLGFHSLNANRGQGARNEGNYGFTFDLSLGSLGSLAEKFKDFKLSLLLGFGFDKTGRKPTFALGYKFAGSGGSGLDIGLGNVLRIRAKGYDVGKHPDRELYYFYAIDGQLVVMDHELPKKAKLNLFAFVDPAPGTKKLAAQGTALQPAAPMPQNPLAHMGWLGLMTSPQSDTASDQDGFIAFDLLALGQKIQLFPGLSPGQGLSVANYVEKIRNELGTLSPEVREALQKNDIKVVTKELLSKIAYAPDRAWMIGLSARIARLFDLQLLINDPDLYGLHLNFQNIIDLDILYRKLSDELGVYSLTLVPPASIRRITTGPADIILPVIGLDFYTDGGVHVDLGYPYNRKFDRSASAEILPFVGSGGMRAGLFRGGGSQLVPPLKHPRTFKYNPVIELGFGIRVGLGKSFEKGPFRAGVSLTVFAYLEGAQGQLEILDPGTTLPKPAATFRVLRGAVGILGEIYGYVDFGIVKAKVEIVAFVEGSTRLRTDDFVLLAYKAGVSVRITVVVARFKVFGKTVEIKVRFSYGTTIEYSMRIGQRRADWAAVYDDGASPLLPAPARSRQWRRLDAPALDQWLVSNVAWEAADPATLGLAGKTALPLWFMPDLTAGTTARGTAEAEAVFKLHLEAAKVDADPMSPYDHVARVMTLWALWAGLRDRVSRGAGDPQGWMVSREMLQQLADRVSGAALVNGGKVDRLPSYAILSDLFARCFATEITRPPLACAGDTEREAVAFPMPADVELLRYFGATVDTTSLGDGRFVDQAFEQQIEDQFDWMRRYWEAQGQKTAAIRGTAKTLAEVLFEEHIGFLLRSFIQATVDQAPASGEIKVADLLDLLHGKAAERPLRSAGAAASRFFHHGLALERPDNGTWTQVRKHIPKPLAEIGDADANAAMPIYRYASLQLGLTMRASGTAVNADAIGLRVTNGAAPWFTVAADLARFDVNANDPIAELVDAADRLADYARTITYKTRTDHERLSDHKPIFYAPAAQRPLASAGTIDARLLQLPDDLVNNPIALAEIEVSERKLHSDDAPLGIAADPATAITLRLRRVKNIAVDGQGRTLFEVVGARENERLLLDTFSEKDDPLAAAKPAIAAVELYWPQRPAKDDPITHWTALPATAHILQSNLTFEPRPEALARSATDYQADQTRPAGFVDIYRRASIVNSSGYWLLVATPLDAEPEIELLMVVTLSGATTLMAANALLTRTVGGGDEVVTAIRAGTQPRLLPRPGEIPLEVVIANPAFGYQVDLGSHVELATHDQLIDKLNAKGAKQARYRQALQLQLADVALRERFDMLEVHVAANRDFVGTKPGRMLPVGNTADDGSGQPPAELHFKHSLPVHELLVAPGASPYAAIGRTLDLRFRLRDIHGNALPGPAREGAGEFARPTLVKYCDGLVDPAELPCLKICWDAATPGALKLLLAFDRATFARDLPGSGRERDVILSARLDALQRSYRMALWQLEGPGFGTAIRTTLAQGAAQGSWDPAAEADIAFNATPLRDFFAAMLKVGVDPAVNRRGRPVADPSAEISIAVPSPARAAFIEPQLSLIFKRDPALVHDLIKTIPNATETRLRVPAAYELLETDVLREPAIAQFVSQLASRVLKASYVGAKGGPAVTGRPGATVWLIRRDVLPTSSPIANNVPRFMALPPLSNRPESFKALDYVILGAGDRPVPATADLVDIDLDAYGQIALERIETILAPQQLARLSQLPEGRELIAETLATKEVFAKGLSDRAIPILAKANIPADLQCEARDKLRQRLLQRLSVAYDVDTLLAYDLAWQVSTVTDGPRPGVSGRLRLDTVLPDKSTPVDLLFVTLPEKDQRTSALIVPYDLAPTDLLNPAPAVDIGDFVISHVQRQPQLYGTEIFDLPPSERYRSTQWLRLIEPLAIQQFRGKAQIPVALRRVPEKPMIGTQVFEESATTTNSIEAWRKCTLRATWKWSGTASDNPVAIARYWVSEQAAVPAAKANGATLGKMLLQFVLGTESSWAKLTDTAAYTVDFLRYLISQIKALQTVQTLGRYTAPAPIEDRVTWYSKSGSWTIASQSLQGKHAVSYTLNNKEGEVVFTNIDVMRFSKAQFGLELYRNRTFPIANPPVEAADPFVYQLKDIWAAEPLTPHVKRPLPLAFDTPRSLRDHLSAILKALFDDKLGRHRFDVHLTLVSGVLPDGLSGSIVPGDWPGAPMRPIVGLYSDEETTWTRVADAAEAWLAPAMLDRRTGYIGLWVRVYREASTVERGQASAETQPIFEAKRLRIPLAAITSLTIQPLTADAE